MNHCTIARQNESNHTWNLEHALTCEARHLLTMKLNERREYIAHKNVAGRLDVLKARMTKIWAEK